jgi:hypothetical protein
MAEAFGEAIGVVIVLYDISNNECEMKITKLWHRDFRREFCERTAVSDIVSSNLIILNVNLLCENLLFNNDSYVGKHFLGHWLCFEQRQSINCGLKRIQ